MIKKEYYRHYLPHFQQPGQSYFITWILHDAVPAKALNEYTLKLCLIKSKLDLYSQNIKESAIAKGLIIPQSLSNSQDSVTYKEPPDHLVSLMSEYYTIRKKYLKAYNDLLDTQSNPYINLSKPENLEIITQSLQYWHGKKLKNHAFCIMPNHIHWVLELLDKDLDGKTIYLQDILQSVKRFTSNRINKIENRKGTLWQKESFDTTIRDDRHLYFAKKYTLYNPVKAGLVSDWHNWRGSWCNESEGFNDF